MKAILMRFHGEESGASLVEYGLLIGLIAVGAIVAIGSIGDSIQGLFSSADNAIQSAT